MNEEVLIEHEGEKILMTYRGERHSLKQWEKITGVKAKTIRQRMLRGWAPERALFEPMRGSADSPPVIRSFCMLDNGCQVKNADKCKHCGFNYEESERRKLLPLTKDANTGLYCKYVKATRGV